jgi:pimeloyl-ACP methyl ester carboxylesterase
VISALAVERPELVSALVCVDPAYLLLDETRMHTDPFGLALASADPLSRAIAWEGAGHWLHQERPAEFNALVSKWLASLVVTHRRA